METNEIMTNEEEIIEEETTETENGSSIGSIVLGSIIGSGLTLAGIAGGKKLKKMWTDHKAKKEAAKAAKENSDDSEKGTEE